MPEQTPTTGSAAASGDARMDRPAMLDYARPMPRRSRLRRVLGWIRDQGPLAPRPSFSTVMVLLVCVPAATWLAQREEPWRLVRSDWVGRPRFAVFGEPANVHPLPRADAIASATSGATVKVWRPWTGEVLREMEVPPVALPPRPVAWRAGTVSWVTASADESKLMAKSELGTFLWDAHTGRLIAQMPTSYWLRAAPARAPKPGAPYIPVPLPRSVPPPAPDPYLGDGLALPEYSFPALSPDGSRLAVLDDDSELRVYDITGDHAKLLAKRQLDFPLPSNVGPEIASFFLRFSPDGKRVVFVGNAAVWAGDADTLEPRLSIQPQYCMPRDVAFLGGDRLLVTNHGWGFGQRGLHLYDLADGRLVRSWLMKNLQEFGTLAVSPDGRRAYLARSSGPSDAGVVVELDADRDGVATVPPGNWFTDATFFRDNRRIAVTRLWGYSYYTCPAIIDTATRRHLSTLHPTTDVSRVIVSGDGTHVGLVLRNGVMELYRQTRPDSAWGVMATPQFWTLAALIALLVASLCRDALHTRRRRGRTTPLPRRRTALAAALVIAGGAALLCPFVLFTLPFSPEVLLSYAGKFLSEEWPVYLFLLHLLAGLGLLTGSRAWTVALVLLLVADVGIAGTIVATASEFRMRPERIFDRYWMLPPVLMVVLNAIWGLSALAGLVVLRKTGARGVSIGTSSIRRWFDRPRNRCYISQVQPSPGA